MNLNDVDWVAFPKEYPSGIAAYDFDLEATDHVEILVCGLGFFKLRVNGRLVSKELNNPVWSDYAPRQLDASLCGSASERFTHRYYYRNYAISSFLRSGMNRLTIEVANGWYRQDKREIEGKMIYGDCLVCGFILLQNGKRIGSSQDDVYGKPSIYIENNIFEGEKQDLSLFDGKNDKPGYLSGFVPLEHVAHPDGESDFQDCPCDEEIQKLEPVLVKEENGLKIYDAGMNVTGYPVIRSAASEVRVEFAEEYCPDGTFSYPANVSCLNGEITFGMKTERCPDGKFNHMHTEQVQRDIYVNAKPNQLLKPGFSIHGFRYFSVKGGEAVSIIMVHTKIKTISSFHTADPTIQWIYDAYVRTQLENYHSGVPSDCPHRERLGYTGDGQLTAKAAMMTFDVDRLYRKWIRDILDCQDQISGHVQHTAPFYGGGGGPGGWGSAIVIVPYLHYRFYHDESVLLSSFDGMKRWVTSMEGFSENGLVVHENGKGWCLGEWLSLPPHQVPDDLVNTYYFASSLQMMAEIAEILHRNEDKTLLLSKREYVLKALKEKYVKDGMPLVYEQAADAFLIDLGLCNEKAVKALAHRYLSRGWDTGMFGTYVLMKVLFEHGHAGVAYRLLTLKGYPSFSYEIENGATTLWEGPDGTGSRNHPMFGALVAFFYSHFAGIQIKGDGYVDLNPQLGRSMLPLRCRLGTKNGYVEVRFAEKDGKISARTICKGLKMATTKRSFEFAF